MNKVKLRISGLTQQYDGEIVLNGVSLEIFEGELVVLLGPSGCGKTTLLKSIAGLVPIARGAISVNERSIENLPPQQRNLVMIFQHYALFPHMSVRENISYGLKVRGVDKIEMQNRTRIMLDLLKLGEMEDRSVSTLSGGQQQRVAIGRALIVNPDVLLLDEPLSNLDERLRLEMRGEIRRVLKATCCTSLYVTHDQDEAMAIADRIVIMREGTIEQVATPDELYRNPISEYVAEFLGHENIFPVEVSGGRSVLFGGSFSVPGIASGRSKVLLPSECIRLFRPEAAPPTDAETADLRFEGVVEGIEKLGVLKKYLVRCPVGIVRVTDLNRYAGKEFEIGETVLASVDPGSIRTLR
ncbi:MAG: ABC transporter ATP-binding protein [Treponemataceae bacterium]